MIIQSIEQGDTFVNENGNRIVVEKIFCAKDEQWETSISYRAVYADPSFAHVRHTTKARSFVLMIQESVTAGNNFVTQLHAGAESPVEEIGFTPSSNFGSRGNGATSQGSSLAPPTQTLIERNFIKYASKYGFQSSDLGRPVTIVTNGRWKTYTIVGLKPRNHKYPIILKNAKGRNYRFEAARVKSALV